MVSDTGRACLDWKASCSRPGLAWRSVGAAASVPRCFRVDARRATWRRVFPVLLHVGDFPVATYGVLFALGIFVGIAIAAWRAPQVGVSPDVVWEVGILVVVGTMVGSRAEYVRTHWSMFADDFSTLLAYRDGGMVFYGGFVTSVVAIIVYGRLRHVNALAVFDAIAPYVMIGASIGRFGCLAAGCCYGSATDLPWAITFPDGAVAPALIARHPTQVYESIYALAIGLFLAWVPRSFVGQRFALLMLLYGTARFGNEFLRGDVRRGFAVEGLLTNGQLTSMFMIGGGVFLWWLARKRTIA